MQNQQDFASMDEFILIDLVREEVKQKITKRNFCKIKTDRKIFFLIGLSNITAIYHENMEFFMNKN